MLTFNLWTQCFEKGRLLFFHFLYNLARQRVLLLSAILYFNFDCSNSWRQMLSLRDGWYTLSALCHVFLGTLTAVQNQHIPILYITLYLYTACIYIPLLTLFCMLYFHELSYLKCWTDILLHNYVSGISITKKLLDWGFYIIWLIHPFPQPQYFLTPFVFTALFFKLHWKFSTFCLWLYGRFDLRNVFLFILFR